MRSSFFLTLLFSLLLLLPLSGCNATADQDISSLNGDTEANTHELSDAEELIAPLHLSIALEYEGVEEVQPNSSPTIDQFLAHVDLDPGLNYCAAFVSFVLESAKVDYPDVQSGVAQHFITDRSISAKQVLRGVETIPPGEILVFKHGSTWRGHTGFVIEEWTGAEGITIEANTSPGPRASPNASDGVHRKERMIEPGSYFRITHFTPVRYS